MRVFQTVNQESRRRTVDQGHPIVSAYDWLGRRLSRTHPDAGLTTYAYDPAGNMTSTQTANLKHNGGPVTYAYHFERLVEVWGLRSRRWAGPT